jgi:hypothetical protein
MKGKAVMIVAALAVVGLYIGYAGWQLLAHSQACDSSMRHCPVPPERLMLHAGAWCNPESMAGIGPVREEITRSGDGFIVRRTTFSPRSNAAQVIRFHLEMGQVHAREYDPRSGVPSSGYVRIHVDGADRRVTEFRNTEIRWIRCDRMAEAGIPPNVRAAFGL